MKALSAIEAEFRQKLPELADSAFETSLEVDARLLFQEAFRDPDVELARGVPWQWDVHEARARLREADECLFFAGQFKVL